MNDVLLREVDATTESAAERDTRLTLRLSPEARETLQWIANERRVSFAEAIRRALGTERFLIETRKARGRILVEQPGERMKELILV